MLRFKKESDLERVNRLKNSIVYGYIEDDDSEELLVSEADLEFLVTKAEERIQSQISTKGATVVSSSMGEGSSTIEPLTYPDNNNSPF